MLEFNDSLNGVSLDEVNTNYPRNDSSLDFAIKKFRKFSKIEEKISFIFYISENKIGQLFSLLFYFITFNT